VNHSYNAVTSL